MSKRKHHAPEFEAKVALEALKGEDTAAELASWFGVHPTMIHQWKRALLESASGVFERGGRNKPEIDEGFVVGMRALQGYSYDGHTLAEALERVEILTDQRHELAVVDRGYRGHGMD